MFLFVAYLLTYGADPVSESEHSACKLALEQRWGFPIAVPGQSHPPHPVEISLNAVPNFREASGAYVESAPYPPPTYPWSAGVNGMNSF